MKSFMQGAVLGGAIVGAALMGYAFGGGKVGPNTGGSGVAFAQTAKEAEARCQVRVGMGRYTGGYQCNFDTVMVGMQSNFLLCADVTVDCGEPAETK